MIQWIALAVAVDANGKARSAQEQAEQAYNNVSGSSLVIIRPVDIISDPNDKPKEGAGFFSRLLHLPRRVLSTTPWATLSLKKGDLLNFREFEDDAGSKYVRIEISQYARVFRGELHMTALYVPGSIEEVTSAIGGI